MPVCISCWLENVLSPESWGLTRVFLSAISSLFKKQIRNKCQFAFLVHFIMFDRKIRGEPSRASLCAFVWPV